jgi:hypothetical protein
MRVQSDGDMSTVEFEFAGDVTTDEIRCVGVAAQPIQLLELEVGGRFLQFFEALAKAVPCRRFRLRYLGGSIERSALISALQDECVLYLPAQLKKAFTLSEPNIYYGVDRRKIEFEYRWGSGKVVPWEQTSIFLGPSPERGALRVRTYDSRLRRHLESFSALDFASTDTVELTNKYRIQLKIGFELIVGQNGGVGLEASKLNTIPFLRSYIDEQVRLQINAELSREGDALSRRIAQVQKRPRVVVQLSSGFRHIGPEPTNEIETIILFARLTSVLSGQVTSNVSVEIVDYSPRGIDCIGIWKNAPQEPSTYQPIEFEYHLGSFFSHGHPFEHTRGVVCFTRVGLENSTFAGRYEVQGKDGLLLVQEVGTGRRVDVIVISELKNVYVRTI